MKPLGLKKALWREYIDGVIDHANGSLTASPGKVQGPKHARWYEQANRLGFFDAKAGNVMREHAFTVEEMLARSASYEQRRLSVKITGDAGSLARY